MKDQKKLEQEMKDQKKKELKMDEQKVNEAAGKAVEQMQTMQKNERIEKIKVLNNYARKGQILFTGSSLMEQFPIDELLMSNKLPFTVYNRGVGGYTTTDMLSHMEEMVFGTEPSKIFINIGTNDIGDPAYTQEKLIKNYEKILRCIQERLPKAKVYVMAYYPVNETDKVPEGEWGSKAFVTRTNENIHLANEAVKAMAHRLGYEFINVNQGLTDDRGKLKKEFTVEGIHMYANAYQIILKNLVPYLKQQS